MKKLIFIFLSFFLVISIVYCQNIIRKGFFGIKAVDLTDSVIISHNLNKSNGILITDVLPNSTAEAIKLVKDDILISINNLIIKDMKEYREIIRKYREGKDIEIKIIRNKSEITLSGKMLPAPYETSLNSDIIYDEVKFRDGYIRLIINKPKIEGKHKTIFFIPGYTCISLDNLGKHPYGQLIDGLSKKGYVVMRSEKPGMGDNMNTPDCDKINYYTELDAFVTAYEKLKSYDFVDRDNIYIFGHSLGGYEAPMVAEKSGAKGVIVCGTGVLTWYEYIIEMFRFQNIIAGSDYIENEILIQKLIPLLYEYLIQKKTPEEIVQDTAKKSLLTEYLEYNGGDQIWSRHYSYWQELQDLNMPQIWKNITGRILVIRGEGDFEAFSNEEHLLICDIVNKYHPGNAKFILIPDMDHGFAKSKTPAESYLNRQKKGYYYENFNPVIIEEVDRWIRE